MQQPRLRCRRRRAALDAPTAGSILFTAGKRAYTEVFSFDVATGKYSQLTRQKTLQLGSRSKDGRVVGGHDGLAGDAEPRCTSTDSTFDDLPQADRHQSAGDRASRSATAEVVTWKSSDGMEVEGVLLKPVGFEPAKRYPLLVVAHGGPSGAFTNNYRVGGLEGGQLWAGQGWAVFYPNPRGSTNYGEKFLQANINDWGGGDYRDIMTGVDAMIARGIADPDRLAHIGWSYGGYMTAWVITQTNRFKAAMVGAGLTNMVEHVRHQRHSERARHLLRRHSRARRRCRSTTRDRRCRSSTT